MIRFTPFLVCAILAKASFATPTPFTNIKRQAGDVCPADALSCQAGFSDVDSCCVETPGGLILQTQFWNFKPAKGPVDSWTIHGLWPNECDNTFDQTIACDPSRELSESNIRSVLAANGKQELLDWMEEFWPGIPNNEYLWKNEWNRHGTCLSTLAPKCMPEGSSPGLDVAIYFQKAADTFKNLSTYEFLASAGIEPHKTKTYTLDQLESAFKATYGFVPALDCKNGSLNQIYYYFNLKGTITD
ncbi:ribonuclease T2-like, partial [Tulasnella sp. UAMH 9824]